MKPAIEVKNLSKQYIINHKNKASYSTLKDDFANFFTGRFSKEVSYDDKQEKFWALNDVSFEVPRGEIFGVIGQNGSGKSTLLKILSRIAQPTSGTVTLRGRVASLLEVGTGFHPELTGRENIYFNGSMLGMSRQEISRKFNEIVEFSEVEKFIDTPVKFYSSGMYVRLAFSVAAHLDPEILILDEVLAVGDAAFQQKSLNKILETMQNGKTVLFVSHSMGAVRHLCSNGIFLDKGRVLEAGNIDEIIEAYSLDSSEKIASHKNKEKIGTSWQNSQNAAYDNFTPEHVYITDAAGNPLSGSISNDTDHFIHIEGTITEEDPYLNIGYSLWDQEGRTLMYFTLCTDGPKESWPELRKGHVHLIGKLPTTFINAGVYRIKVISGIHAKRWIMDPDASQVKLEFVLRHGPKPSPIWIEGRGGLFAPAIDWKSNH